jgi:hypothetical protein
VTDERSARFRAIPLDEAQSAQPKISVTAELILHMQELIDDSAAIVGPGVDVFLSDDGRLGRHAADAIIIKFHELADRMPTEVQERHPEISWADLRGMRNRLGHNYRQTDYRIVWTTLTKDLPAIAASLRGES